MTRFRSIFPDVARPLIAMAHVPPLPGTPLYDAAAGVQGLIDHVKRDTELLLDGGFDAILFCNEGDRPYQLHAGLEAAAVMTRVASECKPADRPFGVDYLWDAQCAMAIAVGSGASFMREVINGAWESDMGPWSPDAAKLLRECFHRRPRCKEVRLRLIRVRRKEAVSLGEQVTVFGVL